MAIIEALGGFEALEAMKSLGGTALNKILSPYSKTMFYYNTGRFNEFF